MAFIISNLLIKACLLNCLMLKCFGLLFIVTVKLRPFHALPVPNIYSSTSPPKKNSIVVGVIPKIVPVMVLESSKMSDSFAQPVVIMVSAGVDTRILAAFDSATPATFVQTG